MKQHRQLRRYPVILILITVCAGITVYAGDLRSQTTPPNANAMQPSPNARRPGDKAAFDFVQETEATLGLLNDAATAAHWRATVRITDENARRAAEADVVLHAEIVHRAARARGFSPSEPILQSKLQRLRLWADGLNANPRASARRASLQQQMTSFYEQTCPIIDAGKPCLQHDAIAREIRNTRDPARLRRLWEACYNAAAQQAAPYRDYTDLLNEGARDSGRRDAAEVSRAAYDTDTASFEQDLEVFWTQVRPLYRMLHAYARIRLGARYPGEIDPRGPLPMHLLGNIWGQEWEGISDILVAGENQHAERPVSSRHLTPRGMVEAATHFFESMGFPRLPNNFWNRSFFERPVGIDGKPRSNFACHPTAWMIKQDDWRLRVCFQPTWADFLTAHHETGHIFYFQSMHSQSTLFREAPNEGLNEAVGDAVMLSVTPKYLAHIGLGSLAPPENDIDALMRVALRKLVRIPFGLALQRWRWGVQSGSIPPARYNQAWWELVREYQGLAPPAPRPPGAFDPAAKFHIAADVDYVRYILADLLTFQIHAGLAKAAACAEPLHRCSAYGSLEAGTRLRNAMSLGASQPWQDVLEAMTGFRSVRSEALRHYLAPLEKWLLEQIGDAPTGW